MAAGGWAIHLSAGLRMSPTEGSPEGPVAQRAMLCGPGHSGMCTHGSSVQRPHPSCPAAPPSLAPPRPVCASPLHPSQPAAACLPQGFSPSGTHTHQHLCLSFSNTHAPRVRGTRAQPWLYLEEARCHGACCHCIVGGYAPHHRAGGSCSALQGGET